MYTWSIINSYIKLPEGNIGMRLRLWKLNTPETWYFTSKELGMATFSAGWNPTTAKRQTKPGFGEKIHLRRPYGRIHYLVAHPTY